MRKQVPKVSGRGDFFKMRSKKYRPSIDLLAGCADKKWTRNGDAIPGTGFRRPARKWKKGVSGKQNKSCSPSIRSMEDVVSRIFLF